tara:strand:- start:51 stop:662 length:612 start_codon:yes stop_codon:yes gene_type:complete
VRREEVTIVDYGIGNIQAFWNIYSRLNIPVKVAKTPSQLLQAKKLILPGVGAFDWAMERLNGSGLQEILTALVVEKKIPVLGICVGMQMMAKRSDEGSLPGLGWFDAEVRHFDPGDQYLPHMGWNDVKPVSGSKLFAGISDPKFYFLHSYFFSPHQSEQSIATTNYGIEFTSVVAKNHMYGVQFHPEKSHNWGIKLLKNFGEI